MNRKCLLLLFLALIFVGGAQADRVGVYPGVNDLGTVERGEMVWAEMLLVGGSSGDIANLNVKNALESSYTREPDEYDFRSEEASRESPVDWISLNQKRIVLEPEQPFMVNGERVDGNAKLSYILEVPEDAEPGYHIARILPSIQSSSTDGQIGIATQGIGTHNVVFRVPGEVSQDGSIVGFNAERASERTIVLKTYFQNTGNTTLAVRVRPTIASENGSEDLTPKGKTVEPEEVAKFESRWSSDDLDDRYNVSAVASWGTNSTEGEGSVQVPENIVRTVEEQEDVGKDEENKFSLLIPLIVLLVIVYAALRRDKRIKPLGTFIKQ